MITELESTKARVQRFGHEMDARIRQQMREQLECKVQHYARHPNDIDERLRQLDQEWDLGRRMQANAAGLILGSLILGRVFRILRPLSFIASGFLLMHALRGWSPPGMALRRLGVRTRDEIEQERHALKALRGDFGEMPHDANQKVDRALRTAGIHEHARA